MIRSRGFICLPLLAMLAACGSSENDALARAKSGEAVSTKDKIVAMGGATIGTPMAERIAVLGLLNKRNGQTRDVELKPGEAIRFDKVVIRLRACEKTAPWETRPDEGAFVQLLVKERPPGTTEAEKWRNIFSGWLFKENPAANVVEHPIYDVWIKACKMRFPGEETALKEASSKEAVAEDPAAIDPSSAPQSPPAPAPTAPDDARPEEG